MKTLDGKGGGCTSSHLADSSFISDPGAESARAQNGAVLTQVVLASVSITVMSFWQDSVKVYSLPGCYPITQQKKQVNAFRRKPWKSDVRDHYNLNIMQKAAFISELPEDNVSTDGTIMTLTFSLCAIIKTSELPTSRSTWTRKYVHHRRHAEASLPVCMRTCLRKW